MRALIFCAIALQLSAFSSWSVAGPIGTAGQHLAGFIRLTKSQCDNAERPEEKLAKDGKISEARSVKISREMLCHCMPEAAAEIKASLSEEDRSRIMTSTQFEEKYQPQIIHPCVRKQNELLYGYGCAEAFSTTRKNSRAYCGCMAGAIKRFTDLELAIAGEEASDWTPKAAEAERYDLEVPKQPPTLRRLTKFEESCRKRN